MEFQTIAQRECVSLTVIRNGPICHLWLWFEIFINSNQHVIDHISMITRDMCGGDDRIENTQIGMHDCSERCFRPCIASAKRNQGNSYPIFQFAEDGAWLC
ncbi:hypothetical protein D3C80_959250 [compost metagenome]